MLGLLTTHNSSMDCSIFLYISVSDRRATEIQEQDERLESLILNGKRCTKAIVIFLMKK